MYQKKTVQIVHENAMQYDSSNFLFPSSPLLVAINVFLLFEFSYKVTIREKVATNCQLSKPSFLRDVSFSSCQQNLIKTFQIDGMIALITKMDLIFS